MNPFNETELGKFAFGDVPSFLRSDENLVGSASPSELVEFAIALAIAYFAGLFCAYYLRRQFSHRLKRDHLEFWIRLLRTSLVLLAAAITVPPIFDAGLIIVIWLLIGFIAVFAVAGQKVVGNIVAGLAIMYERPFAAGDFVSIDGMNGTVLSLGILAILMRTSDGILVHIPNELVYTAQSGNYHTNVARRFEYVIGIRYRDDAVRAAAVIMTVIDQYTFALRHPAPEVFVGDLGESSVNMRMRIWFPSAWADTQDDITVKTAILFQVRTALEKAGIEVPFPQRTLWFGNGSTTR